METNYIIKQTGSKNYKYRLSFPPVINRKLRKYCSYAHVVFLFESEFIEINNAINTLKELERETGEKFI